MEQKLTILKSAEKIRELKAAELSGVHDTTL